MPASGSNRRAQRFMGLVALVCAAGLAFVALAYDAPWWSRLVVFVPLWVAGIGLLPQSASRRAVAIAAGLAALLALLP